MMRAELRRLHSPDVHDLESYCPEEPDNFGFLLQAMIGPAGGQGEESFDIVVCTPQWLKRNHDEREIVLGRDHLIVFRYDYKRLENFITGFVTGCDGRSWGDLAQQLSRLGKWEFEDYRP